MTFHSDVLRSSLGAGEGKRPFLTLELSPPKGIDTTVLISKARQLSPYVDAINVPDCQRALLRMSALATSVRIQQEAGVECVWQLTCRDRNLLALQADLLGAYSLGLRSVLALTGDPIEVGDHKGIAQNVRHLESLGLIRLITKQLNQGHAASEIPFKKQGTNFTVGAALTPQGLERPAAFKRLCQKLEAGVHFFQTQPVYEKAALWALKNQFEKALEVTGRSQASERAKLLVGMVPPRHAEAAHYLNQTVPGIHIPQAWIEDLESAGDNAITQTIHRTAALVSESRGAFDGIHLMPVRLEKYAVDLAKAVHAVISVAENSKRFL
jgi:methylenetetrahydrofolate reductase (NADPH)